MNRWNYLLSVLLLASMSAEQASAAEWVKVAENSVKDQFFVDKSSIQRKGDTVWYWEYREFLQPNNAFVEETVDQPVHGVVLNWSVDCANKVQRLRQITAYDKSRKLIQRFVYGDNGSLLQAQAGSSARNSIDYVCKADQPDSAGNSENAKPQEKPSEKPQEKPSEKP